MPGGQGTLRFRVATTRPDLGMEEGTMKTVSDRLRHSTALTLAALAMAGTLGVAGTVAAQDGAYTTTVAGHAYGLRVLVDSAAPPTGVTPDGRWEAVVTRDGIVTYRTMLAGPPVVDGWRDATGNGLPDILVAFPTSRSTGETVVLEVGPRGLSELGWMGGQVYPTSLTFVGQSSEAFQPLVPLAGALAVQQAPTVEGYAFCVHSPDPMRGGTAVVLRDGRVAYHWRLMGPAPMPANGQPADGLHCLPVSDMTGNGHPNAHISDMTSRSTTQHVILDLGPEGVSEVFNRSLFFTEHLDWADTNGDGVLEPTVIGEGPGQGRPQGIVLPEGVGGGATRVPRLD